MIDYDGQFWMRFYCWAVATPMQRAMGRLSEGMLTMQITIADHFTPAVTRAMWAFEDFAFALQLADYPRWQRPFRRFAYRIYRLPRLLTHVRIP